MYRNWKGAAVLGLAALIGCMMPVSTMQAAEDIAFGVRSVSDNDSVSDNHTEYLEIVGIENGKTYPEGTLFMVKCSGELDCVLMNGQTVSPENGYYKVVANGTSCEIIVKDKAGHEIVCKITVSGITTPEPKPEEPKPEEPKPEEPKPEEPETPDDGMVISKSGEYELKAGVKYHLAEGKWKVNGDKSTYRGDSDFYVTADGSYRFSK